MGEVQANCPDLGSSPSDSALGIKRNQEMSRSSHYYWLPITFAAVLAWGCGGPADAPSSLSLNLVKGKVLLENGKPLTGGNVVFVSSTTGLSPNGKIAPDGSFTIRSGEQGEGAPAGEYKVRIEPDPSSGVQAGRPRGGARLPFPAAYTDEDNSGLKVTVKSGDNTLEPFKLSSKSLASLNISDRAQIRD